MLQVFLVLAVVIVVLLAYRRQTDRAAVLGSGVGAVGVGLAALVTLVVGAQMLWDAFASGPSVVRLAIGINTVGTGLFGLVSSFVIYSEPASAHDSGSCGTDRLAAALLGLLALVLLAFGIHGMLFSCPGGGGLCVVGVVASIFLAIAGAVGLGLGLAIWKQPRFGRLLGLLATALLAAFTTSGIVASVERAADLRPLTPIAVAALVSGAAYLLLLASSVRWLASKPPRSTSS